MRYELLPSTFFAKNRKRFAAAMKPNSIAIFKSSDMMPRTGDQYHLYRQNPDLYYFTGVDQEETILLMYPDCVKERFREVLFVRRTDEHTAIWEGAKLTKPEAAALSGIDNIIWYDELNPTFNELVLLADNVYINCNENDRFVATVEYSDLRFAREMRERYPNHNYFRSAPIMKKLRTRKSEIEVQTIQHACNITEKAFRRVLEFTQPNVWEFEIEAEITHEFIRNRATGHAYTPIIASGANACVLHYITNDCICKDGDLILLDFGAEYGNYAADLTRCIPASGRFTKRQREVYDAVLRVHREVTTMLVPGNTLEELNKEVGKLMESELIGLRLIDRHDVAHQNPDAPLYKKYFMHGNSHHLGLDVHDLMNRYDPFRAGNVFTNEPGIYIREEGIGIRIENDLLITDDGTVDLMKNIPIEADEIETLMNAKIMA